MFGKGQGNARGRGRGLGLEQIAASESLGAMGSAAEAFRRDLLLAGRGGLVCWPRCAAHDGLCEGLVWMG